MSKNTMHFDACIRNGTVVTAAERFHADVGICGKRIVAIATVANPVGSAG